METESIIHCNENGIRRTLGLASGLKTAWFQRPKRGGEVPSYRDMHAVKCQHRITSLIQPVIKNTYIVSKSVYLVSICRGDVHLSNTVTCFTNNRHINPLLSAHHAGAQLYTKKCISGSDDTPVRIACVAEEEIRITLTYI